MIPTDIFLAGYKVLPLSGKNIHDKCDRFLRNYMLGVYANGSPSETNLEEILEFVIQEKGASRRLVHGLRFQCDYARMVIENGEDCTIEVDEEAYSKEEWDPHFRFSLAHELGHMLLHFEQLKPKLGMVARSMNVAQLKPFESSEWQANRAASELLMDADRTKQIWRLLRGRGFGLNAIIIRMATEFSVSSDVVKRRLKELNLTAC